MEKLNWVVKLNECHQRFLALGSLLLWEQLLSADRRWQLEHELYLQKHVDT